MADPVSQFATRLAYGLLGIRRAELLVYRGVGHTPRWEDPSRFARDVHYAHSRAPFCHA